MYTAQQIAYAKVLIRSSGTDSAAGRMLASSILETAELNAPPDSRTLTQKLDALGDIYNKSQERAASRGVPLRASTAQREKLADEIRGEVDGVSRDGNIVEAELNTAVAALADARDANDKLGKQIARQAEASASRERIYSANAKMIRDKWEDHDKQISAQAADLATYREHFADVRRIAEWMRTSKPPELAFTAGPERIVATWIAEARKEPTEAEQHALEVMGERDVAENLLDNITSVLLNEPIDWACHEEKWREAIAKAGELAADNQAALRLLAAKYSPIAVARCTKCSAIIGAMLMSESTLLSHPGVTVTREAGPVDVTGCQCEKAAPPSCQCAACLDAGTPEGEFPASLSRVTFCPACGNKSCPSAESHANECAGNNEPECAAKPEELPMIRGRQPIVRQSSVRPDKWIIEEPHPHSRDFLFTDGTWGNGPKNDCAHYYHTREAAEAFVREQAAKEGATTGPGPQRGPASVRQIDAQQKRVAQDIDAAKEGAK